jgi:hypothetical protein
MRTVPNALTDTGGGSTCQERKRTTSLKNGALESVTKTLFQPNVKNVSMRRDDTAAMD